MALGNLDVIHLTYILQGHILLCYCFAIKELLKLASQNTGGLQKEIFLKQ